MSLIVPPLRVSAVVEASSSWVGVLAGGDDVGEGQRLVPLPLA